MTVFKPSPTNPDNGKASSELELLNRLRLLRRKSRHQTTTQDEVHLRHSELSFGQKFADLVASTMGSWRFIIIQSILLLIWVGLNVTAYVERWDPYPFILLNLALSFQAAYAAPIIMMSQNRQQDIDRQAAKNDYQINIKARTGNRTAPPQNRRPARRRNQTPHPNRGGTDKGIRGEILVQK